MCSLPVQTGTRSPLFADVLVEDIFASEEDSVSEHDEVDDRREGESYNEFEEESN
jgi:hypothetical protein